MGWSRERRLGLALAGGYLLMLVETWLAHHVVAAVKPLAWIPVAAAGAGALALAWAAWRWTRPARLVACWTGRACLPVSLVGLWFHWSPHLRAGLDLSAPLQIPPLLAPLALGGLGLMTWIATADGEPADG